MISQRALLGIGIAAAAAWCGLSFLSLYSPQGHGADRFREPTLQFLRAGLALDSEALSRMDAAPPAIHWILDRARKDPDLLNTLANDLKVSGSRRNGDRNEVTFEAKALKRCGPWPLTVYFSGAPAAARIEALRSGCDAH